MSTPIAPPMQPIHDPIFDSLSGVIAWTIGLYVIVVMAIGVFASRRIHDTEDYVVAGRRLSLWMSTSTLLATWFGAETLMTTADEIRDRGVEAAALDPIGVGLCLILVGLFFARALWGERLTTLPELFGRRYGPAARTTAAVLMVPPYIGWVAAQFMALSSMIVLFFDVPLPLAMCAVAAVGVTYTLIGGMWAVAMTDALQVAMIVVGLCIVTWQVVHGLGDGDLGSGLAAVLDGAPPGHLRWIPTEDLAAFAGWTSVLCAGALGNIASQDVMQRVFSARSADIARRACLASGGLYLALGLMPILLGLAATVVPGLPSDKATIPALAVLFLQPALAVVFVVTLLSIILSTIDSALLAPATVLARDVWSVATGRGDSLRAVRVAVLLVGVCGLAVAFMGEDAYGLLSASYELGMVTLLCPLVFTLLRPGSPPAAAMASMVTGTAVWFAHMVLGLDGLFGIDLLPIGLVGMAISGATFIVVARRLDSPRA